MCAFAKRNDYELLTYTEHKIIEFLRLNEEQSYDFSAVALRRQCWENRSSSFVSRWPFQALKGAKGSAQEDAINDEIKKEDPRPDSLRLS